MHWSGQWNLGFNSTNLLEVRSEPCSKVEVRGGGDDVDECHHGHQANDQVDGDESLVDGPGLLAGAVPGYEVPQSHRGEGDEAVVEGVKQGPDGLHQVQHQGGQEEEEEEDQAGHQAEVENSDSGELDQAGHRTPLSIPDLDRGIEMTELGVHQLQQLVDRSHHLLHQNTEQEQREGYSDEGVDHAEHFSW